MQDKNESYKQNGVIELVKKRLPWLILLLALGLVVSGTVGMFEQVAGRLPVVIRFQSLILGMAGNVGTQSLAVTIRALAEKNLTGRQSALLVAREGKIGLINGLALGAFSFVLVGVYLVAEGESASGAFSVSACTGAALTIAMALSGICGTAVPLAFRRLHIDPAVASGPLITTVNDLVAVVTYYGLVWFFLV